MLTSLTPIKTLLSSAMLLSALTIGAPTSVMASATIGQPAPALTGVDTTGKTVKLSDFKGKTVVLEWVNPNCPFVRKHYDSGNMQGTQRWAGDQGVVWLAVNSTSDESSEYKTPPAMAQWMNEQKAAATATLMDPDGQIGLAYGARTTPHMYIVNGAGTLVYAGAIDSKASARQTDIAAATNHVKAALTDIASGKPISVPVTRPYGCSVKYKSS